MAQFKRPAFLITIDTEGDNVWSHPKSLATENANFLPRFQTLCDSFGFKPTYLVNYEMASDARFVQFARAAVSAGRAEVGTHLHAWNSPPLVPLTSDDNRYHPYLTEFPKDLMAEKFAFITRLLEDRFEQKMTSHRGGRWAFDENYARLLLDAGYLIDCSVTPDIHWSRKGNQPAGINGPDFRGFSTQPYWIDPTDIRKPGNSSLLEAPMTIRPVSRPLTRELALIPGLGGFLHRRWPQNRWLRPNGVNTAEMVRLCDEIVADGYPYAMFMLHSSEFMPGGSPAFPSAASIERLYGQLRTLFGRVKSAFDSMTLAEFRKAFSHQPTA